MNNPTQDFFEALLKLQFLSADVRRDYQRGLLERLLRHAREQVPYYRDGGRLDVLFRPDGTIDWDRWQEVPVLTRREAQLNAQALYAEVVPPECGAVSTGYTAGSSGAPLAFRINALMGTIGSAIMERGLVWAGMPAELSIAWFRSDKAGAAAYPHGQVTYSIIRGTSRATHHLSVVTPIEQQGQWLARVRPDVVISYPGALAQLAQELPALLSDHKFRLAICLGEVTTETDRAAIERGMRCPVLDLYSGSEFGPVAVEDPSLRRMFVCEETSLVEFMEPGPEYDGGDHAVAEVIVTPFYNYAMPLIRYACGDHAVLDRKLPPDARTLRRLERVAGRERNVFILPSGRQWWPTFLGLRDVVDYRQIQYAQIARDRIEIRYASDAAEPIKDADKLDAYLRIATPEPMQITLRRVERIERRASGKYEITTRELDPELTAARIDAIPESQATAGPAQTATRSYFAPTQSPPYQRDKTVRALLQSWRDLQIQPEAALQNHQRALLEALLRHARANVPFYRDSGRLDPVFRGDGSIDWERWPEIPPLSRSDVQQAGTALHAEFLPLDHGHTWVLSTSGSTGEPVQVVHDALSGEAVWSAVRLRDWETHKIDATQKLACVRSFVHDSDNKTGLQWQLGWGPHLQKLGHFGERLEIAEFLLPARIINELIAFAPTYLQLNAAELEILFNWDQERRLRQLNLEAVITINDHLSEELRRQVTEHLQAKIVDRYASEECGNMATSCAICGRFHVHAESIYTEVVSDDGLPVGPGGTGWIFATPLYNYAMPLIRYDHADRVRVGQPGLCSNTLPVLDSVLGKDRIFFTFPDGSTVRPMLPPTLIARDLGAQVYQVVQTAPDRCEFRIVPGRIPPSAMRFDEITRVMRARWWKDLQIDFRVMDELPKSGSRRKVATFLRA
jgi:phenylacetate-CoA ligase